MAKHPHYEVMMEWAADTSKVVQVFDQHDNEWIDIPGDAPAWYSYIKYRIKPKKKPDHTTECKVLGIYKSILWNSTRETVPDANLRLTFDGETGKLIKAEVLHAE